MDDDDDHNDYEAEYSYRRTLSMLCCAPEAARACTQMIRYQSRTCNYIFLDPFWVMQN